MPNAFDPTVGSGIPLSHNPLQRINVVPPKIGPPDLNDLIDAMQAWISDLLFPSIKRYTGIDLTPFLPLLNNVIDNLQVLFGFLDQDASTFDKVAAGAYLIENVLQYTGLLATIESLGKLMTGIDNATGGQISQFFNDIRYIIGDPLGLGTGTVIIGSSPFDIPLLAPVTELVQNLIDAIVNALGYPGSGYNPANVLSYLGSVVGDVSTLVSGVAAFVGAVGGGNMAGAGAALAGVANDLTDLLTTLETFLSATGQATWAALGPIINQLIDLLTTVPAELISGTLTGAVKIGGRAIDVLVQHLNAAGQYDAAYLLGELGDAVTVGGQGIASVVTDVFNRIQAVLDAIANALGHIGTGHLPGDVQGYLTTLAGSWNSAVSDVAALLTNSGQATATALGSLISQLLTMLNQISDIFHGSLVTPVNSTVSQVQDWFNANVAYLANIPNTAVQGLTGFGTNMGNTVQSLADGVWQGLRAFLGIPSGVAPPQVSTAAQRVRTDLNNASDIATAAAKFQSNQSISKQSYLSIDPSADPVFPLANITGASPSSVTVTPTKSVMGIIGLPDNGLKKSVVWLGGSLTGITGVYVNIYKVNTTTGVFTRTHASSNIIGSLTSPVSGYGWQFYNLPSTAFFPTLQGEWYVAEIQITGTANYSIVGVSSSWMPTHTSVYPKALGASRDAAPPTLDAVGAGATGGASPQSYSHVIGASATAIIIGVSAGGSVVPTVTVGGVAATQLAGASFGTNTGVYLFGLLNPPTGTKTITVSGSGLIIAANSVSYSGVSSFGTGVTATGSGSPASQTISSTANQVVVQAMSFMNTANPQQFSGYNRNLRYNKATAAGTNYALLIGDFVGASGAMTGSATSPVVGAFASVMVPLIGFVPSPPSSIAVPVYDSAVPWISLAGGAGRAQHVPETVEFETAGTFTYNVPSWVIDGDYIDVVPIGAGAGGSYCGLLNSAADPPAPGYLGGGPGQWNPIRLRYGDSYDIPTGTTTFTVNVGSGGAGGPYPGETHVPAVHGSNGGNTTVVITGHPTITANGGTADGSTSTVSTTRGGSPGNVTHQGVTYFGGAEAISPGEAGHGPGGGGARGDSIHRPAIMQYPTLNRDVSGGVGAPGACYITAVQDS
ncbi:hypothetical protein [Mycobacterium sp. TY813]|uniref:glycine-rich domain-containing protein n=1 Tax=Mycobacterium sp. TY813 TaxID=3050579 RepID=UPI0027410DB9|nr:hypothetical protein [Mycobacterium sp. TY813]MDP7729486.1 hypothetical protein [Mycobacterium sp. TY813]